MTANEIKTLEAAAATGDSGAQAAFADAIKEVAQDASQSEAGFCGYHPEMGEAKPVAHMEARLAHYGEHYYVDTPLELKGRGIKFMGKFNGVPGSRKTGWNTYKVTLKAFEALEAKYRVASEMLL